MAWTAGFITSFVFLISIVYVGRSFSYIADYFEQGLRLHLDYSGSRGRRRASGSTSLEYAQADAWAAAYSGVAAGAALVAGLGVLAYLKRNG